MPENSLNNQEQGLQEKIEMNNALTERFNVQSIAIQQTEKELIELRMQIKELVDLGESESLSEGELETIEQSIQEKIAENTVLLEEFKQENKQIQETRDELTVLSIEIDSLLDQSKNQLTDTSQDKVELPKVSLNQELTKELEEQQISLAKINSQIEEVDQLLNKLLDQEGTPEELIQEILYTREALIENIENAQTNLQNITNELQNLDFISTNLKPEGVAEEASESQSTATDGTEEESQVSNLDTNSIPSLIATDTTSLSETPESLQSTEQRQAESPVADLSEASISSITTSSINDEGLASAQNISSLAEQPQAPNQATESALESNTTIVPDATSNQTQSSTPSANTTENPLSFLNKLRSALNKGLGKGTPKIKSKNPAAAANSRKNNRRP